VFSLICGSWGETTKNQKQGQIEKGLTERWRGKGKGEGERDITEQWRDKYYQSTLYACMEMS
jgi:hypothetical protein